MDLLATKAANLFPEMERSSSYIKREQLKESLKEQAAANGEAAEDSSQTEPERYHLYIYDRVSGNSYVPKVYRNCTSSGSQHYHESQENPTDRWNRPPHYLCYIPPCVRRCPGFMEQNAFCEFFGRWGFHGYFKNRHEARRRVFLVGFLFNFCALGLTVYSAMAFTRNYTLLTYTSFSHGKATIPALSDSKEFQIDIGFRALAWTDPFGISGVFSNGHVITFTNYCEQSNDFSALLWDQLCGSCKDSSRSFVLSTVVNIFIILRNMFSDVTRMYPKYDLNCPNFYGSLMATVSFLLAMYTVFAYAATCAGDNFTGEIPSSFVINSDTVPQEIKDKAATMDTLEVHFEWVNGTGLNCLIAATFLKIIDAICNYIVPTPAITRSLEEQRAYELEFGTDAEQTWLHNQSHNPLADEMQEEKKNLGPSHLVLERLQTSDTKYTDPPDKLSMVRESTFGEAFGDEEEVLVPQHDHATANGANPAAVAGITAAGGAAAIGGAAAAALSRHSTATDDEEAGDEVSELPETATTPAPVTLPHKASSSSSFSSTISTEEFSQEDLGKSARAQRAKSESVLLSSDNSGLTNELPEVKKSTGVKNSRQISSPARIDLPVESSGNDTRTTSLGGGTLDTTN